MREYEFKKVWLTRSRKRAMLTPEEAEKVDAMLESAKGMATMNLKIGDLPKPYWQAMLYEANLTTSIRTAICLHLYGMREGEVDLARVYEVVVDSPTEFGNALELAAGTPNIEININDRWYPVILSTEFLENQEKVTVAVRVSCNVTMSDQNFAVTHLVNRELFTDPAGGREQHTVIEVLEGFGFRRLQTSPVDFNLRLVRAERFSMEAGKVVNVANSVVIPARFSWWRGFEIQSLGTPEMPSRCVLESALEVQNEDGFYGGYHRQSQAQSHLPFVRLFSLETKSYVYADVDDIEDYEFETNAFARLHLPADMHSILSRVFQTPVEKMFGDILKGKHGGVVVLASGSPGVGKTLTAEIYAETTQRPLYVLELGELGTAPSEVEENLQRVFARVTRWNAVLQFDECEIFLAKRGTDLERSAIVGIFLRLLDYYRGLLFLTTNRPDALDDAILSRIMLRLDYPDLDACTRANVWRTMFDMAGLELQECSFEELGLLALNGRQIRNITRLAKILNPDLRLSRRAIEEALKFGAAADSASLRLQ